MNKDYDENSEPESNSPQNSELLNTENGERRSFHTAFSPEDTEYPDKTFENQDNFPQEQTPPEDDILEQNQRVSSDKDFHAAKPKEQYRSSLMMSTPDEFLSFQANLGWRSKEAEQEIKAQVEDKTDYDQLYKEEKLNNIDLVESVIVSPSKKKTEKDLATYFEEPSDLGNGNHVEKSYDKRENKIIEDEKSDRGIGTKVKEEISENGIKNIENDEHKEEKEAIKPEVQKVTKSMGTETNGEKSTKNNKELYDGKYILRRRKSNVFFRFCG